VNLLIPGLDQNSRKTSIVRVVWGCGPPHCPLRTVTTSQSGGKRTQSSERGSWTAADRFVDVLQTDWWIDARSKLVRRSEVVI